MSDITMTINEAMARMEDANRVEVRKNCATVCRVALRSVRNLWDKAKYQRWSKAELTPRQVRMVRLAVRSDPDTRALVGLKKRWVSAHKRTIQSQQMDDYRAITALIAESLTQGPFAGLWVVTDAELSDVKRVLINGETLDEALGRLYDDFTTRARRGLVKSLDGTTSIHGARDAFSREINAAYKDLENRAAGLAGEATAVTCRRAASNIADMSLVVVRA